MTHHPETAPAARDGSCGRKAFRKVAFEDLPSNTHSVKTDVQAPLSPVGGNAAGPISSNATFRGVTLNGPGLHGLNMSALGRAIASGPNSGRQPWACGVDPQSQSPRRGYKTHLVFLGLDSPERCITIRNRAAQGGHIIPDADVRRRYARSIAYTPRRSGRLILPTTMTTPEEPRALSWRRLPAS
jgi:hypothetical protein